MGYDDFKGKICVYYNLFENTKNKVAKLKSALNKLATNILPQRDCESLFLVRDFRNTSNLNINFIYDNIMCYYSEKENALMVGVICPNWSNGWGNISKDKFVSEQTGKTYSSIQHAVSIVEEKLISEIRNEDYTAVFSRYLKYKDDGLIAFTTFHQSFSYEEFIEGIRPVVFSEENTESTPEIEYEVHDGVFKAFCDKAGTPIGSGKNVDLGIGKSPTVWKVSLEGTGDNPTRTECLANGHIRIGWDNYGESITDATDYSKDGGSTVLNAFYNRMQIGDIIMSCYSSKTIDAIGVVTGEPEWHDEYQHYKRLRKVKWLVKDINEDIVDLNAGKTMTLSTVYKLSVTVSDALQILRRLNQHCSTRM